MMLMVSFAIAQYSKYFFFGEGEKRILASKINAKILDLSYKISILAFMQIVLDQRYLEMIAPLHLKPLRRPMIG